MLIALLFLNIQAFDYSNEMVQSEPLPHRQLCCSLQRSWRVCLLEITYFVVSKGWKDALAVCARTEMNESYYPRSFTEPLLFDSQIQNDQCQEMDATTDKWVKLTDNGEWGSHSVSLCLP